jgi:hypothetical protein
MLNQSKIIEAVLYLDDAFINSLDFSKLFYIKQEASYFILNKIPNYISKGDYKCELIRLKLNFTGSEELPPGPQIVINSFSQAPDGVFTFVWEIITDYVFLNYNPTGADIFMKQLTASPLDGGVPTGFEYTGSVNLLSNQFSQSFPLSLGSEWGWYEVQIIDDDGLESNIEYVYIDEPSGGTDEPYIFVTVESSGGSTTTGSPILLDVDYSFNHFTPTTATITIQAYNFITGLNIGSPTILTGLTLTPDIVHTFTDANFYNGIGFYRITVNTDVINFEINTFII